MNCFRNESNLSGPAHSCMPISNAIVVQSIAKCKLLTTEIHDTHPACIGRGDDRRTVVEIESYMTLHRRRPNLRGKVLGTTEPLHRPQSRLLLVIDRRLSQWQHGEWIAHALVTIVRVGE